MNYRPKIKPKAAADDAVPPPKKGKSWLMKLISWLHLWPSIVSGVILVFVCITGTIIVYGDEIMDWSAGEARFVPAVKSQKTDTEQIFKSLHDYNPNLNVSEFVFFNDPERSIRIRAFDTVQRYLSHVYVDQYTGKVLKEDKTIFFFYKTAHLHADLSAGKTGGWIVTVSTIIFLISSVTGLVLWWPARWTKRTREASFTVKWKAKFKRVNYDLHNVYGFYSLILCVILSATGIIIFFHPLGNAVVKVFGGSSDHIEAVLPKIDQQKTAIDMVATAYSLFDQEAKNQRNVAIWANGLKKSGVFVFSLGKSGLKSTENLDLVVIDRYTGKRMPIEKPYLRHENVENVVWQLHMGQWWGQLGKLSTFLSGIVATSLPITGFLIWWGRRNKKSKKRVVPKSV